MIKQLAPLFVIIAAALWGVDGIVLRPTLYTLPVSLVVFIESVIVALILSPFFTRYAFKIRSISARDWLVFIGIALLGGAVGTMSITRGLFYVDYVNLSIVVLIQKLQPLFAIALAALVLKERLSKAFFVWAVISVIGAYLMTFGMDAPNLTATDKTTLAAMFALIATISFAASTVLSKLGLRNVDYRVATYLRFLLTSIIMALIVLSSGKIWHVTQVSDRQIVVFLIIAFSTGGPAIFLYYYGLKRISASVATICELAFPLTAVVLEYLLRKNLLGPIQWLGVVLLLVGIMRVTRLKTPAVKSPS